MTVEIPSMCTVQPGLVEGEWLRKSSIFRLTWSREFMHANKNDGVSSDVKGESRVVFPLQY